MRSDTEFVNAIKAFYVYKKYRLDELAGYRAGIDYLNQKAAMESQNKHIISEEIYIRERSSQFIEAFIRFVTRNHTSESDLSEGTFVIYPPDFFN